MKRCYYTLQRENLKFSEYINAIPDAVKFVNRFVPFVIDMIGNLGPIGSELLYKLLVLANGQIHNLKLSFFVVLMNLFDFYNTPDYLLF